MVTWNERDDAREAFIAGSSGARKNTGTTKDTREAFTRGRTSAKEFRRRGQYKSPEDKRYTPGRKTAATKFTDKTGDIIRDAGGDFMDMVLPVFQKTMQGIGSIGANWKRNKQNREILEDAYTDEVHQAMVPNWNISKLDPGYEGSARSRHDKWLNMASMMDPGKERDEILARAKSTFSNAQITNRINYALGQPEYGFDTTAPAAVGAWNAAEGRQETEAERLARSGVDYSALAGNMAGGLDATKEGRAFLANAYKKQAEETGEGPIGDALWAYHPDMFNKTTEMGWENMAGSEPYNTWSDQGADPFYGGRSPTDELYAATTTMDPFVEGSSPVSRQYKDMWLANLIDEEDTPLGLI